MRDLFPGYFNLSEEETADIFKSGIITVDTNVLLNFYRYSPDTSRDFLALFQALGDRVWISNRVMEEFYRNRKRVIQSQERIYDEIRKIFERAVENLEALLTRGHLSIDTFIVEDTSVTLQGLIEQVDGYKLKHPNLLTDDTIRKSLEDILTGKVGDPYDTEKLAEIYAKTEQRFMAKQPPGYKDAETKSATKGDQRYGDLLVWLQIIDKARTSKKDVIFVTDEKKEDWWWIDDDGEMMGPRPELVREIGKVAKVRFYMCSPTALLDLAQEHLGINLGPNTVSEIQKVEDIAIGWKDEIIAAFRNLGGQATWSELYEYIRTHSSRRFPSNWQAVIRYTVFANSSDSEVFRGGEDLFVRLGRGKWGLRLDSDS